MRFVLPAAGILAACVCFGSVSVSAAVCAENFSILIYAKGQIRPDSECPGRRAAVYSDGYRLQTA